MGFVVAIDGPAASGKGTLARRLASHYGFHHLDTGLTYRATAQAVLAAGGDLEDEAAATRIAQTIDLGSLDREMLSRHEIGEAASRIAVMAPVRQALVVAQQAFSRRLPGTVLDGRDIGTVVCPQAEIKLFVTADPGVRAGRRYEEIIRSDRVANYDDILADIHRRDARDMGREDSPLRPAEDAHLLDTSEMSIETAFQAAKDLIDRAMADGNPGD